MKARMRIVSLLLALLMVAGLFPLEQLRLIPQAEAADYNLTIDFNYAEEHNVTTASDALRLKGEESLTVKGPEDGVNESYWQSQYDKYSWKHARAWTVEDTDEGDLRRYLTSKDPADTYISLTQDDTHEYHSKAQKWHTIEIRTDKVLDLNGHKLEIQLNTNRNNSDTNRMQNKTVLHSHNEVLFEILEGATLTIIDSSAWRGEGFNGKGTGKISFTGYMVDPYKYDIQYYTTRDMFKVSHGNLVIYGGTFQAGRKKDQLKDNFSWSKLKNVIGSAVEMGVSVAGYATGINAAADKYKNLLEQKMTTALKTETGNTGEDDGKDSKTQTMIPPDGKNLDAHKETKKDTPKEKGDASADTGRDETVSEKKDEKNKNIDSGKPGTKEGENKENEKKNGKDDKNSSLADAQNNIVNQVVNEKGIMGIVNSAFSLCSNIAGMIGKDEKSRVTQSIKGTVVQVGNQGSFVAYGGTFQGYGSTPNTRNAVIEVNIVPETTKTFDHSKTQGGLAFIYGGVYEAYNGANVFNMIQYNDIQFAMQYVEDQYGNRTGPTRVALPKGETNGVEVIYYDNQEELAADTEGKVTPIPVNTANVQVRGGTFRCFYDVMNVALKQEGDDQHFSKFPGTSGSVNLGIESFNNELIQDGRIQIVDRYGDGALVLLDERKEEDPKTRDDGLYHYRMFCGDNEIRVKTYLDVYPNTAKTNSSHSMQLATYVGTGRRTGLLFQNSDEEYNRNERAAIRQTENYFDYMIDSDTANNWSVMPNFHFTETDDDSEKMDAVNSDVYGERLDRSEVWYYPQPLDADGEPLPDRPFGAAGYTGAAKSGAKMDMGYAMGNGAPNYDTYLNYMLELKNISKTASKLGYYRVSQKDYNDKTVEEVKKQLIDPQTLAYYTEDHTGIRNGLKFFTYKVYRVDPLTRENLSESDEFGVDEPLIEVRYGAGDGSEDALKCKLPLKTVEREIMARRPNWKGYQQGELYRIVFDVEEMIGVGYQGQGVYGATLPTAKTETSILFRCFLEEEQQSVGSSYLAHDFTSLQWARDPQTKQVSVQAGQTAQINLVNGKGGMTDFRGDVKVFDLYYQWWEVDVNGEPIRMLAGTDNYYVEDGDDTNGDYGDHRPESWDVQHDGKTYINTVDPKDPESGTYGSNGLPNNKKNWKNTQLHAYLAGTVNATELTKDGTDNLHLGNNKIYAFNTDSCYIPEDMAGKYIRVRLVAQNVRWPVAYDPFQTFWSHTVRVSDGPLDPLSGSLGMTYTGGAKYATYDKPVTLSFDDLDGLAAGEHVVSVYYWVSDWRCGGQSKDFTGLMITDPAQMPKVTYPNDFFPEGYDLERLRGGDRKAYVVVTTDKDRSFYTPLETLNFEQEAKALVPIIPEDQTYKLTDIENGKYDNGVRIMETRPLHATLGVNYKNATSTDPDVAVMDESGLLRFGRKPGTTQISVKGPDGNMVSRTINVLAGFSEVEITGLQAPKKGQPFQFTAQVPEDAPYTVKDVIWCKNFGSMGYGEMRASDVAEKFEAYTATVAIEPKPGYEFLFDTGTYSMTGELADGTTETKTGLCPGNSYVEEVRGVCYFSYTFDAIGADEPGGTIRNIYVNYPTEVPEGTNWDKWLAEDLQITTDGYDEHVDFTIYPAYSANAEQILSTYSDSTINLAEKDPYYRTFIKGAQTGLVISGSIDITEHNSAFSSETNVYINGEKQIVEGSTTWSGDESIILVTAPDTITVTDGAPLPVDPDTDYNGFDLVVGQPFDLTGIYTSDNPGVTAYYSEPYSDSPMDSYLTYDAQTQTVTPKAAIMNSDFMAYVDVLIRYDLNGDGYSEYRDWTVTLSISKSNVYSSAAAIPQQQYGTYHATITAYNPDGSTAYEKTITDTADGMLVPEVEGAFYTGLYKDGVKESNFLSNFGDTMYKRSGVFTTKLVSVEDLVVNPGTDMVFAYIKDEENRDVEKIQISVDGVHYIQGDTIAGLEPNTEYLLYYRQGINGRVYTKIFRTASTDYDVRVGRSVVTESNLGNLDRDGWQFDPDTRTLTLKEISLIDCGSFCDFADNWFVTSGKRGLICAKQAITINLIGDNYLETYSDNLDMTYTGYVIYSEGDITFTGNGDLLNAGNKDIGVTAVYSRDGSIVLSGTGTQTIQNCTKGYVSDNSTGKIYYRNGTIRFVPEKAAVNDYQYQNGVLFLTPENLVFSGAVHETTISAAGLDEVFHEYSESDFRQLLEKNNSTTADSSNQKKTINIVPQHSDSQRVAAAEYLRTGSCDRGCTYFLSCTCGHIGSQTFTVGVGSHTLETRAASAPTCVKAGWNEYQYCTKCQYSTFGENYYEALGHDWEHHNAVQPTCDTDGYPAYDVCKRCGLTSKARIPGGSVDKRAPGSDEITASDMENPEIMKWKATGHEVKLVLGTAPTCTATGIIQHYECVYCGEYYRTDGAGEKITEANLVDPALGHAWGPWVTVDGKQVHTCERCGKTETQGEKTNPFEDVKEGAFYFDPVLWAVAHEPQITAGVSATRFAPGNTCTRAQVVTFLWRAKGQPEPTKTDNPFTDVSPSAYYYKAVLWAVENGITAGVSKDRFAPNNGCTRGQVVTFLWRTEGQPEPGSSTNPFNDVPASAYYYKAVLWAVNHQPQITAGVSKDRFAPGNTCTRGQIVTFLYRDLK